jgi:hypothetical protein
MQGKPSKKACIPFISLAESGLFKGLRAKKLKNPARAQLAFEVVPRRPQTLSAHPPFSQPMGPPGLIR